MVAGSGLESLAQPVRAHNALEHSEDPQAKDTSAGAKLYDAASDPKALLQDAVYRPSNNNADSFLPKLDWGDTNNNGDATVQLARSDRASDSTEARPGAMSNDEFVRRALSKAQQLEGQKLWVNTPYSDIVGNGEFGCAASLGKFLNGIGERVKPSPLAVGLKNNLLATNNWTATRYQNDDIAPGSVIFGTKAGRGKEIGGGASHIAIVVGKQNGQLMVADNNGKLGGRWDIRPLRESFPAERYNYSRLQVLQRKSR
jgi:hypothetical protein